MGIFDSIRRALGDLRPLSDKELEDEREALRQRYVSHGKLDNEFKLIEYDMGRYDNELRRRANEAYDRENPNPPKRVHREHGWYLPNDD